MDGDVPVLYGISLTVPAGKPRLCGTTTSSKSTLVKTVAAFYEPQQGRILLDG